MMETILKETAEQRYLVLRKDEGEELLIYGSDGNLSSDRNKIHDISFPGFVNYEDAKEYVETKVDEKKYIIIKILKGSSKIYLDMDELTVERMLFELDKLKGIFRSETEIDVYRSKIKKIKRLDTQNLVGLQVEWMDTAQINVPMYRNSYNNCMMWISTPETKLVFTGKIVADNTGDEADIERMGGVFVQVEGNVKGQNKAKVILGEEKKNFIDKMIIGECIYDYSNNYKK